MKPETEQGSRLKAMVRRTAFNLAWFRGITLFIIMLGLGLLACTVWALQSATASPAHQPEKAETSILTNGPPVLPISAVIPCNAEDFKYLPMFLTSVANQTAMPHEVILVVNIPRSADNGSLLLDLQPPAYLASASNFTEQTPWSPEPLQKINGRFERPTFAKPSESLQYVIDVLPPAGQSLARIPDFKLFIRAGDHWAGNNRWWGANQTREGTELVSFFDCDDYMHPQRFEFLYRTFQENPELEALVHSYQMLRITEWPTRIVDFLSPVEYPDKPFQHTYQKLWSSLPVQKLSKDATEPEQVKDGYTWWFPKDMRLPGSNGGHNGWLTIKREVLDEIPYPDIRRGQDSLYNWRLLSNKRFWNFLNVKLGGYVRFK